jgi:hypothetical protein
LRFFCKRYRNNLRMSSLNLSTSSSTSSFSSMLSEQSQMPLGGGGGGGGGGGVGGVPQQPSFLQTGVKSVALSYYHHLYNEKVNSNSNTANTSSSSSHKRGVSANQLQPLYKTTYAQQPSLQQSQASDENNTYLLNSSLTHGEYDNSQLVNQFQTNKGFKNEFSRRFFSRISSTTNNTSSNNQILNYSTTTTTTTPTDSISSNNSLTTPNDIKHVKFRYCLKNSFNY